MNWCLKAYFIYSFEMCASGQIFPQATNRRLKDHVPDITESAVRIMQNNNPMSPETSSSLFSPIVQHSLTYGLMWYTPQKTIYHWWEI